jgi:hypothetical protein
MPKHRIAATAALAACGHGSEANVDTLPTVRLVATSDHRHIEVWHTPQPEQYQVTQEQWMFADEPGQVDVRHILEAREVPVAP